MKRISVCIMILSLGFSLKSQTPVGSPPPSGPGSFPTEAAHAWYRGGNLSTTNPAGFNIFGFRNSNSPEIWFQTGGFNRILLGNSGIPLNGGKIVFGNNISSPFALLDRLQSHITIAGDNMFRFTNPVTGPSEGFRLGLHDSANVALFQHHHRSAYQFEIRDQANTPNRHLTKFTITNINQTNNPLNFYPTYTDATRVGIWDAAFFVPNQELAMLHIGRPNSSLSSVNWGTHRDWMNIGTFYDQGSDAMYVGLHEHAIDQTDAVIVWGDNPIQTGPAADRLKFIFTVDQGGTPASNASAYNGLEVARMTSDARDGSAMFNDRLNLDPQNSVHIIGQTANGNSSTAGGNSGLRLHFVQAVTTPTIANPGHGVLSVNANGDVIYVGIPAPPPSCCVGNQCGAPFNPLPPAGWNVPLNNTTYNFTSLAGSFNSQVNIGFPNCVINVARLNTETDIHRFAGAFINNNGFAAGFQCVGVGGRATSTNTNAVGVKGEAVRAPIGNSAIGVEGESDNSNLAATNNIGVHGYAANGRTESVGGAFRVIPGSSPSATNIGVRGNVNVTNKLNAWNIGGSFTSSLSIAPFTSKSIGAVGGIDDGTSITSSAIFALPAGISIGVYGFRPRPPAVAASNTGLDWAGYFDGDIKVVGVPFSTNPAWVFSDRKYKTNIAKLDNVNEKLKKLSGYTYNLKAEEYKEKGFDKSEQIGLIAQELKEVFPQLVKEDSEGSLTVNYSGMIPVLLEAIKEQQKQIDRQAVSSANVQKQLDDQKKVNDALQSKMDKLEQMINSCCSAGSNARTINGQNVDLSDKNVIILNQNVPNPFAESTVITYNIPVDFKKAQINFSTTDGKIIRTVDITSKGEGRLNVFANDLTSGLYTYTLIVDGKVIDTKKMVKD